MIEPIRQAIKTLECLVDDPALKSSRTGNEGNGPFIISKGELEAIRTVLRFLKPLRKENYDF